MPYHCPMLFCIKLMISEPISIRYTLKPLILHGKTAKPLKIPQFFKEFSKNSEENHIFLIEVALDYHFRLNYFKMSWK